MFIIVCWWHRKLGHWLLCFFLPTQVDHKFMWFASFCPALMELVSHYDRQISYFSSFILCIFALTLLFWGWCEALIDLCLHTDQSIDIDANLTQVMDNRSCEYAMDQDIMLGTSFVIRLIIYCKWKSQQPYKGHWRPSEQFNTIQWTITLWL